MTPTAWILLLWLAFAVTHLGLASVRVEPRIRERIGRAAYLGLYSAIALVLFVPLLGVYFDNVHTGAALWGVSAPGPVLRVLLYLGNALAMVMVAGALLRPSPGSLLPGGGGVAGVYRWTRHPMMMGFALTGVLHLVSNGAAADVAFFGGLAAFSLAGAWHQDQRKLLAGDEVFLRFHGETPFLPFARGGFWKGLREVGPLPLAVGLGLAVFARWMHGSFWPG